MTPAKAQSRRDQSDDRRLKSHRREKSKFGATAATGVKVISGSSIEAVSPAGTGTVHVTVTTLGGTSATSSADQFTYVTGPTVTRRLPTRGPTGGGTKVTIAGSNLTGATEVKFGATERHWRQSDLSERSRLPNRLGHSA